MKTSGELSYRGYFKMDLHHPDSVQLHSQLLRKNFKILSYGKTDLRKMNDTFNLPVYSNDRYLRTIHVGPSNPNFLTYQQIPPSLIYAVLTAEDGSFMWHKGINEEAFRKSIIANIKAKRFKRGGSTISMQLVKNIFLHKNKTVSRKLEELLMVWLIENLRLSSKERMLEIYFNVIEWGPNVYGINEASHYYFSKAPSALQWNEIIFLTSIIPSPKKFMYEFDEKQQLKNLEGYYNIVSKFLVRHGHMTQLEKDSLKASVVLNGPAKLALRPMVEDSLNEADSYNAEEIIQMQLK
jgi:membrane peptidoglycan carboxypeptidase